VAGLPTTHSGTLSQLAARAHRIALHAEERCSEYLTRGDTPQALVWARIAEDCASATKRYVGFALRDLPVGPTRDGIISDNEGTTQAARRAAGLVEERMS